MVSHEGMHPSAVVVLGDPCMPSDGVRRCPSQSRVCIPQRDQWHLGGRPSTSSQGKRAVQALWVCLGQSRPARELGHLEDKWGYVDGTSHGDKKGPRKTLTIWTCLGSTSEVLLPSPCRMVSERAIHTSHPKPRLCVGPLETSR